MSWDNANFHVPSPIPFGLPIVSVAGSRDIFVIEGTVEYADGNRYNIAIILNTESGRVKRETWYCSAPLPRPGVARSFHRLVPNPRLCWR
ncbi:MAG: hypothetical protein OEM32_01600 [Acidimicrobiia bacterium]|nr:hypothetical protein [Acidimicrobiia bacterium]